MTSFDGIIKGIKDIVYYKKVKCDNIYAQGDYFKGSDTPEVMAAAESGKCMCRKVRTVGI